MAFKRAKTQIYYRYNSIGQVYEIRVCNKHCSGSIILAECKKEKDAQELARTMKPTFEKKDCKIGVSFRGKYFSKLHEGGE